MPASEVLIVTSDEHAEALAARAQYPQGETAGFLVARDGGQALEALLGGPDPGVLPAVALLDLELAGVDAVEVLRRIRGDRRTRYLPVVVMSSEAWEGREKMLRECAALHANAFLHKPKDFGPFRQLMIATAMFWTRLNEPPPSVLTR